MCVIIGTLFVIGVILLVQLVARVLIPFAMSIFATIVLVVGTMDAAAGIASMLQKAGHLWIPKMNNHHSLSKNAAALDKCCCQQKKINENVCEQTR